MNKLPLKVCCALLFLGLFGSSWVSARGGCRVVDAADYYQPRGSFTAEFGHGYAYAIGSRDSCASACLGWRGPAQNTRREWDHYGLAHWDSPWSYGRNGVDVNALCTTKVESVFIRSSWICPVLRAKLKNIYTLVENRVTGTLTREVTGSYSVRRGVYACDNDLRSKQWLTHIN